MQGYRQGRIFASRTRLRPARAAASPPLISLAIAFGLLAIGRIEPRVLEPVRGVLVTALTPAVAIAGGVSGRVQGFGVRWAAAIAALRRTDELLERTARLEAELARIMPQAVELAALRELIERPPAVPASSGQPPAITARVIASSAGGLSQTVLVEAGRRQGVREGQAVMGHYGLAGRVITVQSDSATVLLLSDRMSRVPVLIGVGRVRGLLAGTGNGHPRLEFLPGEAAIAAGDRVVTSGVGGHFPRDLVVGAVVGEGGAFRVALGGEATALLYVSILQGEVPALDGSEVAGARSGRGIVK